MRTAEHAAATQDALSRMTEAALAEAIELVESSHASADSELAKVLRTERFERKQKKLTVLAQLLGL